MTLPARCIQIFRRLLPELSKFGIVGVIGLLVDVGGFNALRFAGGEGVLYHHPVTAKLVSSALATVVSWVGHRYWTFSDSRRTAVHRELIVFIVMCTIGTAIATGCLAISHYALGLDSRLADNVSANVIGLILGTAFRFWAYHTYVFDEPSSARDEVTVRV